MKFIADSMLGSLTRWLRLVGNDVWYFKDYDDVKLIEEAKKENRILLTGDFELYKRAKKRGVDTLFIKERDKAKMLAQVIVKYGLSLDVDPMKSRCPKCGSSLNTISKDKIKNKVPLSSLNFHDDFWICSNNECGKIYWYGSHWKRISEILNRARELKIGFDPDE